MLVAGQYPFALGCAFALAALVALQRDHPVLLVLCCVASLLALAQLLVFRAFPAGGAFAYPWLDLVGITGFALCGAVLARGDARHLRG